MSSLNVEKWLKLSRAKGVKKETVKMLFDSIKNVDLIIENLESRSRKLLSNGKEVVFPSDSQIKEEIDKIESFGGKIVTIADDLYPQILRNTFNAPILLTCLGNVALMNKTNFSVIGSRNPSINSLNFAYKITQDLAKNGFNIVSGLASGIDSKAHISVLDIYKNLDNGVNTIAVIGTGIGNCYPLENKTLQERIAKEGGLVVSEFNFDALPVAYNFPIRNMTVAGLSYGVLVVEARKNSGSLITAKCAHSFNREVYAVPSFPTDERFFGANELIKNGTAKIINSVEDIIEDMSFLFNKNNVAENSSVSKGLFFDSNIEFEMPSDNNIKSVKDKLIQVMSPVPVSVDEIIFATDFALNEVLIALFELELEGIVVRSFDGGFYIVDDNVINKSESVEDL